VESLPFLSQESGHAFECLTQTTEKLKASVGLNQMGAKGVEKSQLFIVEVRVAAIEGYPDNQGIRCRKTEGNLVLDLQRPVEVGVELEPVELRG
jgi:hypothetical protein